MKLIDKIQTLRDAIEAFDPGRIELADNFADLMQEILECLFKSGSEMSVYVSSLNKEFTVESICSNGPVVQINAYDEDDNKKQDAKEKE